MQSNNQKDDDISTEIYNITCFVTSFGDRAKIRQHNLQIIFSAAFNINNKTPFTLESIKNYDLFCGDEEKGPYPNNSNKDGKKQREILVNLLNKIQTAGVKREIYKNTIRAFLGIKIEEKNQGMMKK